MQDVDMNNRREALSVGAWVFALLLLLAVFGLVVTLVLLP